MNIFVSSVITGMEQFRAAARDAIEQLGSQPIMAEDLLAQPHSPQVACLRGVRDSAAVVLLFGAHYGTKQGSGLSATHEEFREAQRQRCPVFAFIQEGIERDVDQEAFVNEAGTWAKGFHRNGFRDPNDLRKKITGALHNWQVANAASPVNEKELLSRALLMIPETDHNRYGRGDHAVVAAIAVGPRQSILRPSEIEKPELQEELMQSALFGPNKIFSPSKPTRPAMDDDAFVLLHDEESAFVKLDAEGNVLIKLPVHDDDGMVVIEELVTDRLAAAIRYGAYVLDHIDGKQRFTHIALAAALQGSDMVVWRTQREHAASPRSYEFGRTGRDDQKRTVHLKPAVIPRAMLVHQTAQIVEDLITLLRRVWNPQR
jgi:Domain of unknown function (DUF4062)